MSAQTLGTIDSNFNGTAIAGSSYIWFNSHLTSVSFSGAAASAPQVMLYARNAAVTFASGGTNHTVAIPDSVIVFDQAATGASGTFASGEWHITYPKSGTGNPFLSGAMWDVPSGGLSGGTNPVTWSAEFSTNIGTISELHWQWSAAVYTEAPANANDLGVLWLDGGGQSGTPMNYRDYVVGGARGGGGSNFTGSNSATGKVQNLEVVPEVSTLWLAMLGGLGLLRRRR